MQWRKVCWRAAAALLLFLAGCRTVEDRIKENAEVFAAFDPEVQEAIREERIEVGFTREMVAIAWGPPDVKRVRRAEAGDREIWTYLDRRSAFAGRRFAGFEPVFYFDPKSKTHRTVYEPIYVDVYQTVETERDRVEFQDGKAVLIVRAE